MDAVVDAREGLGRRASTTEVEAMTVEQARLIFDRHAHAGDHRCTAPGCTGRWPCFYRLDAIHVLTGGQQ